MHWHHCIHIYSIDNISCNVAFEVPTSEQPLAAADRPQFAEEIQAHRFQIHHRTTIFETQRDAIRCHNSRAGLVAWKRRRRRAQRRWHPAVRAWFHAQSIAKREGEKPELRAPTILAHPTASCFLSRGAMCRRRRKLWLQVRLGFRVGLG